MALTDEKRAELEDAVTDMRLLDETVKTDGWQKIIEPTIEAMRQAAVKKALTEGDNEKDLYKAQAATEIASLFVSDEYLGIESDVDRRIREGQEAVEILAKEKGE